MPKEDWIIVPGMHEAIVSEEEYREVQKMISSNPAGERDNTPFPLKSLVVCGYCGRRMVRWAGKKIRNPRFFCNYGGKYGNIRCRDVKSPIQKELESTVLNGIRDVIAGIDMKEQKGLSHDRNDGEKRLADLKAEKASLEAEKMRRYEAYTNGKCSKEEFLKEKGVLADKIVEIDNEINVTEKSLKYKGSISEEISVCRLFSGQEELTYEMAHAFVEKITVYRDYRVEITWKFRDYLN